MPRTWHQRLQRLMAPTNLKRATFFVVADVCTIAAAVLLAFLIRFDFSVEQALLYKNALLWFLPIGVGFRLIALVSFRVYAMSWRYVSLGDISRIAMAVGLSSLAVAGALFFLVIPFGPQSVVSFPTPSGFPRSILVIEAFLSFFGLALVRITKRLYLQMVRGYRTSSGARTLIIGAGDMGDTVARDLVRQQQAFSLVAFLDDAPSKIGTRLHGVRVIGKLDALDRAIVQYDVQAIIVAIGSLHHSKLKEIYRIARKRGVKQLKIVPHFYGLDEGLRININALEDIKLEDLIGREEVRVDFRAIENELFGKSVMITGACGSIGSDIVKQVCRFRPRHLLCFDCDETAMFHLKRTLSEQFPKQRDHISFVIGDIRDQERVDEVFEHHRPDVVFHAAAYKHVPLMEDNPGEAVKVNVLGTAVLAEAAQRYEARKFVMISSDKAVNPTSVMGATKRVAEELCRGMNGMTAFVSVRFGNVIGSRGSVLPLFLEQLAAGGPLTVTHPDMERYFMTIPEAVSLVLQASVLGRGGEVFALDMGRRVRILDLAEDLIRLHGFEPYDDVDITIVGPRPGEKLFEEIVAAEDGTCPTAHEKISRCLRNDKVPEKDYRSVLREFRQIVSMYGLSPDTIRATLQRHVPSYGAPSTSLSRPMTGDDVLSAKEGYHSIDR